MREVTRSITTKSDHPKMTVVTVSPHVGEVFTEHKKDGVLVLGYVVFPHDGVVLHEGLIYNVVAKSSNNEVVVIVEDKD